MPNLDIKKLIIGFLIFAAITSSSVFLLSGFIGAGPAETVVKQDQDKSKNDPAGKLPDNVFVEPIPSSAVVSNGGETAGDGLPPVGTSSNLTERLAQSMTRSMIKANPNGPNPNSGGGLSLDAPDLDATIVKMLSGNNSQIPAPSNWNIKVSDTDIKVIKNSGIADLENYFESLKKILNDNITDPNLISLVQNGNSSPEAINAVSVSLDQTEIGMKKLSVPEQLLNFHKSFLTLLAYEKNAVAAINSDDPISELLAIQAEEKNYNSAVSNFQNEIEKARSVIKSLSFKGDNSSVLANLFGIQSAHAQFVAAVFDVPTEISTAATWVKIVWGYIKAIALQIIKNQIVHKIMVQTTNWIQGGGKPQFVTNWKGFLGKAGQDAVALAIQQKIPGLCRSFGPLIKIQLQNVYLSSPPQTCTLEEIVQNVKNFYNDFSVGGWIGYGAMILPSGNYFGQIFETTQQIEQEKQKAQAAAKSDAESSKGYLSMKTCVNVDTRSNYSKCLEDCADAAASEGITDCAAQCADQDSTPGNTCLEYKNTTPGTVAGDSVASAISGPLHLIVNANDIVGVVSAFVNSMISELFKAGEKGLSGLAMKNSISGREAAPAGVVTMPTGSDVLGDYNQRKGELPSTSDLNGDIQDGQTMATAIINDPNTPAVYQADVTVAGSSGGGSGQTCANVPTATACTTPDQTALVQRVKNYVISQGIAINSLCGALEITKRVAWAAGAGLLITIHSGQCNGIAAGTIAYPDNSTVDVLFDEGGINTPQWNPGPPGIEFPQVRYTPASDPGDPAGSY